MRESNSCTRRDYLRGVGSAAGTAAGGVALLGGAASSALAEHADAQEPYVTLSYPEGLIKQYQPLLVLDGVENEPNAYHALYAESQESDLDVVVGFHHYYYQEGYSQFDSHLGDREPVYVYVESETGEPVKVQYSAFHWHENTEMWQDLSTGSSELRPKMRVVPKHHQHRTYHGDAAGETVPVANLLESYPQWLSNGLEEEIHPGAVYNPQEEMQHRDYWWKESRGTFWDRAVWPYYVDLGIKGGDKTDLE